MSKPDALALADSIDPVNKASALVLTIHVSQAAAELRRLHAEVEALRKDAKRWRAVRLLARYERLAGDDYVSLGVLSWPRTGHATTPDYADAAIDAAMKEANHG